MKTSKPFSTISYNSVEFLNLKLTDLVNRNILSFYTFVYHYAEADEKKDHIHLIMFPNGQIQTDTLKAYLRELNPNDPTAPPLGVMPFNSSKWSDWFLYSSHDTAYLASKGQTRQYHYTEEDFYSSEPDYLHEMIHTIDRSRYAKTLEFVQSVQEGTPFTDLVLQGKIPAPQFGQWRAMYDYLNSATAYRSGRTTHTPKPLPNAFDEDGSPIYVRPSLIPEDEEIF